MPAPPNLLKNYRVRNMTSIEKSTITVKTAAVITFGIITSVVTIVGTYWASGNAIESKLLKLENRLNLETQARINEDRILAKDISANTRAIEAVNTRVEALRPSTVTTFR